MEFGHYAPLGQCRIMIVEPSENYSKPYPTFNFCCVSHMKEWLSKPENMNSIQGSNLTLEERLATIISRGVL